MCRQRNWSQIKDKGEVPCHLTLFILQRLRKTMHASFHVAAQAQNVQELPAAGELVRRFSE